MPDWLLLHNGWLWAILGLLLIGGEMLAPGVFLIWLGLAALITGAVVGIFGLGWQAAAIVFAVLAVACVAAGRLLTRRRSEEPDAATGLNDRGRQLIGKVFRLETTMTGEKAASVLAIPPGGSPGRSCLPGPRSRSCVSMARR